MGIETTFDVSYTRMDRVSCGQTWILIMEMERSFGVSYTQKMDNSYRIGSRKIKVWMLDSHRKSKTGKTGLEPREKLRVVTHPFKHLDQ